MQKKPLCANISETQKKLEDSLVEKQDIIDLAVKSYTSEDNTELLHRENIEGTPLWIIGTAEKGYFIALGKYKLTESVKKLETARLLPYSNMWDIILSAITIVAEKVTLDVLEELNKEDENTQIKEQ